MLHEKVGKHGTRNRGRYQVAQSDRTDFTNNGSQLYPRYPRLYYLISGLPFRRNLSTMCSPAFQTKRRPVDLVQNILSALAVNDWKSEIASYSINQLNMQICGPTI